MTTTQPPLLSGKYDNISRSDPILLSEITKITENPVPVIRKSLPRKTKKAISTATAGSIHQKILEYLYRRNQLFYIATAHHKNTRGKRMDFRDRFLFQIYNERSHHRVFRKCVQVGISEYMVMNAIYNAALRDRTILYVLPTSQLSNTFVSDRIDPLIRNIPFYKSVITDGVDNKTLKQFGTGAIYFTGAGSSKGAESQFFSSVPADDLILDEYDKIAMHIGEHKLRTAYSRLKSADDPTIIECANPRSADIMIDAKYNSSCQYVWAVPCNHCGKWQTLDWFTGVVRRIDEYTYELRDKEWSQELQRDIYYYCQYCQNPMNRIHEKAEWVALYPQRPISGYHISRLMTHRCNMASLWSDFYNAIGNNILMSLFFGDSLGLGHLATNSEITESHVLNCTQNNYYMPDHCRDMTIAGIDVHKIFLHVTIGKVVGNKIVQVYIGKVVNEDDIPSLFKRYGVGVACFDAMPETRMLKRLREISSLKHIIYAVTFNQTSKKIDTTENTVTEDRTFSIDEVQNMINSQEYVFPANIKSVLDGEFMSQLTSSIRVSDVSDSGKPIEKWVCKPGREDHFLLSMAFQAIAKNVMRKTFNRSLLEEMSETHNASDVPTMALPLFGIRKEDDVVRALYNNLEITPFNEQHYTQLILPVLQEFISNEIHPEDKREVALLYIEKYNARYNVA